ncbi:hypothetical protein ABZU32_11125 [Sphaerisporangium sp. NPDC005288]|uniref:hypothetical protein n=1 Tax=Sphaerisporangium sp. NPDC005288 TaxID=3155114 RepID=UPI0033AC8839
MRPLLVNPCLSGDAVLDGGGLRSRRHVQQGAVTPFRRSARRQGVAVDAQPAAVAAAVAVVGADGQEAEGDPAERFDMYSKEGGRGTRRA